MIEEGKMCASLLLLLLGCSLQYQFTTGVTEFPSRYYPFQDRIVARGEPIPIMQPKRNIDCRMRGDQCSITLNITYMQTMTVYEYDSSINEEVGGRRGDDGYAVNVTEAGTLQFRFDLPNYGAKEFLYPILADGERRTVIAINNQVPGPSILAQQGQTLLVTVVNNLATESLAVHWHGQHVVNTPWMDGVAQVTHCPIPSYTNFTYQFTLDQVGTHWYHAHIGAQRTDGLHGALIVTSDSEFPDMDFEDQPEEHTLIFLDWQTSDTISVIETIASGARFPDPVDPSRVYQNTLTYDKSESAPMPLYLV